MRIETENKAFNLLRDNGYLYINFYSTDCDGNRRYYNCTATGHKKFTRMKDLEDWETDMYENAEGQIGWDFTTEDNLDENQSSGQWGM